VGGKKKGFCVPGGDKTAYTFTNGPKKIQYLLKREKGDKVGKLAHWPYSTLFVGEGGEILRGGVKGLS